MDKVRRAGKNTLRLGTIASISLSLNMIDTGKTPTANANELGGLNNLLQECQRSGYPSLAIIVYTPRDGLINRWTCMDNNGNTRDLDIDEACKQQYGNRNAYSRQLDRGNAYSIRCYT